MYVVLREQARQAMSTGEYSLVHDFYQKTFSSSVEMCALFKKNMDQKGAKFNDPELRTELLNEVHDQMDNLVGSFCLFVHCQWIIRLSYWLIVPLFFLCLHSAQPSFIGKSVLKGIIASLTTPLRYVLTLPLLVRA